MGEGKLFVVRHGGGGIKSRHNRYIRPPADVQNICSFKRCSRKKTWQRGRRHQCRLERLKAQHWQGWWKTELFLRFFWHQGIDMEMKHPNIPIYSMDYISSV
jgi:hypothetical protein